MECTNQNCKRKIDKQYICPKCKTAVYCSLQCRIHAWGTGHQIDCMSEKHMSIDDFILENDPELKILGKGSYGEVRLVRHRETGQLYALKVVTIT